MAAPALQLCLPVIAQSAATSLAQRVQVGVQSTAMGEGLTFCSTEQLDEMLQLALLGIAKMRAAGTPAVLTALQVSCAMNGVGP
jgi:hypothetical protein